MIEIADLDRDVFDAEQDEHLDADTLEAALTSLLTLYPGAPVAAHTAEGVMVAMPESIPLRDNPILEGRSGADLAVRDEHLARGWERVIAEGAARYPVHPVDYPHITSMVYALDLRERHGVLMILVVVGAPTQPSAARPRRSPRSCPGSRACARTFMRSSSEVDEATTNCWAGRPRR